MPGAVQKAAEAGEEGAEGAEATAAAARGGGVEGGGDGGGADGAEGGGDGGGESPSLEPLFLLLFKTKSWDLPKGTPPSAVPGICMMEYGGGG
jgi:hypothetical protein